MNFKKSLKVIDRDFISKSNLVELCMRAYNYQAGVLSEGVFHIHLGGSSGRGKTTLAIQLAKMIEVAGESLGYDTFIKVVDIHDFCITENEDLKADVTRIGSAIDACITENPHVTILITEGQCSNEADVVSEVVSKSYVHDTLCCVVEPNFHSWVMMNHYKSIQTKPKFPFKWLKRWQKIGKLSVSEGIDQLYIDTADSVRFWNKFPFSTVILRNHFVSNFQFPNYVRTEDDKDLYV